VGKVKKDKAASEVSQLKQAIEALNATQHNPVDWLPIVRFIAPLVARIAARYAGRYVATKLNRKLSKKINDQSVEATAERIAGIVQRLVIRQAKK